MDCHVERRKGQLRLGRPVVVIRVDFAMFAHFEGFWTFRTPRIENTHTFAVRLLCGCCAVAVRLLCFAAHQDRTRPVSAHGQAKHSNRVGKVDGCAHGTALHSPYTRQKGGRASMHVAKAGRQTAVFSACPHSTNMGEGRGRKGQRGCDSLARDLRVGVVEGCVRQLALQNPTTRVFQSGRVRRRGRAPRHTRVSVGAG